jgi:peptidoglycan/LPS O-acetylase OafA/YrhL
MNKDSKRIPSLDGLRAISIGLVILSHLFGTRGFFLPTWVGNIFALGELGVRVFFVISGFLITSILIKEIEVTGHISLSKFYLRRTLRIFPPYYVFLAVLITLVAFGVVSLDLRDELHALTYTANYHPGRSWNIGHTWSLSVEEQFYLIWPAALILVGKRRGLYGAALLILLLPLLRLLIWQLFQSQIEIGVTFETAADSLATGCVLAGTYGWLKQQRLYNMILSSKLFVLVPLIVLAANALHDRPRLYFFFGFTIMNLGIGACIDWCVTNHTGRIGKVLNSSPLIFVGVISYSVYLWQQIFLNRYSDSLFCRFPLNLIMVGMAALASYYCVEKPALKLRQRVESLYTGRKTLAVAHPSLADLANR